MLPKTRLCGSLEIQQPRASRDPELTSRNCDRETSPPQPHDNALQRWLLALQVKVRSIPSPQIDIKGQIGANSSPCLSASLGSDDESTIKVAPTKKDGKEKALKLKKSAPKQNKPGNWRDGSVIDGMCYTIDSRL